MYIEYHGEEAHGFLVACVYQIMPAPAERSSEEGHPHCTVHNLAVVCAPVQPLTGHLRVCELVLHLMEHWSIASPLPLVELVAGWHQHQAAVELELSP